MFNYDANSVDWSRTPHIQVGDRHYLNTLLAWDDIKRSKDAFKFSLFPEYWKKYDWTRDPWQTWAQLLKARCNDIRHRYDWVRLWYSGGRDSHPILEAFVANNIHLDEIVVWYNPLDHDRGPEVEHIVLPLAKKVVQLNPRIKLTVIELGLEDYEELFHSEYWLENTLGHPAGTYGFYPGQNTSLYFRKPHLFPQRDRGLKDINIFGLEKPRLIIQNNKWYFEAIDIPYAMHWGPSDVSELFYLSPDLPELNAKQCWLLINHLEKNYNNLTSTFVEQYSQGKLGPEKYDELCHVIGRGAYTVPEIGLGTNKLYGLHRWKKLIDQGIKTNWKPWKVYQSGINRLQHEFEEHWTKENKMTGLLSDKIYLKDVDTSKYNPEEQKSSTIVLLDK